MWKWSAGVGIGLVVLLMCGAAYQYISTKLDESAYPPQG